MIAEAGGDPWAVNRTLQRGAPAQISYLAQAFLEAGQHTAEADKAFEEARRRFVASWNREHGEHPINDAAEVQRVTRSLGVQSPQLAKIAVDLELVAAALSEAQRHSATQIHSLEGDLENIDHQLGKAIGREALGLISPVLAVGIIQEIMDLEQKAIDRTASAWNQINGIRDKYSNLLHDLMTQMRTKDGYDGAAVVAVDAEEPGRYAEQEVRAALAGDQAAAARVNSVLDGITEEQRTGKAPLTAEQAAMLSQLQAQEHGMSVADLHTAEQRLGAQRQLIGNSWQLMSNGALVFPRTELRPGALQGTDPVKGSAELLPASILQAFEAPWPISKDQQSLLLRSLTGSQMRAIADIVKHGNPALQTNTELDRRMIRRAFTLMESEAWQSGSMGKSELPLPDASFDHPVTDLLTAASRDHQVVHGMLTSPDRDNFLRDITNYNWADRGKSVASLFDWIEGAAHGPEAGIAGDTAHAYASYVGNSASGLLHLPGNHTVGEMNPELIQSMAHGLAPYMSNIAGIPGGLPEFGPALDTATDFESGHMPVAKGIFSVLSTDKAALECFHGAADERAILAESSYAQALAGHAPGMDSYDANLHDAMTLRGLVDSGIHAATQADAENHHTTQEEAQRNEYTSRKTAYEVGARLASAAAGLTPGVGAYLGPGVGVLGAMIENDFIGPAPRGSALIEHPVPDMPIGQADREILNSLIAFGQPVPIAPEYLINGRIATPDELAGTSMGFNAGAYDQVLSRALHEFFSQHYGNGVGKPLMPDQFMIDRYDAVIKDSRP
ncbi:hypothetical protein [Mycobacterium asiaticum]|uniref:putative alpha/beta hydrolase n=1 Tax=Mycobacterium asiaticum TaxID=1790 RepID=UPI0009C082C4|nr:hypothetical protein [Mycobacterium asiaticum]